MESHVLILLVAFHFNYMNDGALPVSYLETRHPVILDGYLAIWTGFGGTGTF